MKRILPLLMICLFAHFPEAQNNYNTLWNQVEQFEIDGLPKSALKIVEQIESKAKSDNNSPQQIKCLLYKSKFMLDLEEDAKLNVINAFKTEIANSTTPTKNVLENILAQLYWQYFQQNRWKFYNRTERANKTSDDFRTWDLNTLFKTIDNHFENSLNNGLLLQQTPIEQFSVILEQQDAKTSKLYRPTLFDFLSHQALKFYQTSENSITKPAHKFEIDNPKYASDAKTFIGTTLETKDTLSLEFKALKIYQALLAFHLKDKTAEALVDADIARLDFIKQHATFKDKDAVILNTLKQSSKQHSNGAISGLYNYKIAQILVAKGNNYLAPNPATKINRWHLQEALMHCNDVIKQAPNSLAAEQCKALKQKLLQPTLYITTERYIPIQQHAKMLVRYKNEKHLEFKAYKLSEDDYKRFRNHHNKTMQQEFLKDFTPTTTWSSDLRDENDYQTHTTELLIPKLQNGRYIITALSNNTTLAITDIQVTNMALVELNTNDNTRFQIINRLDGTPITDAKISITYRKNYRDKTLSKNFTTNALGEFIINKTNTNLSNIVVKVTHQDEIAYFGNFNVYKKYDNSKDDNNTEYRGYLFTDRSIYRPGQILYFKGIATAIKNNKTEVFANQEAKLKLKNPNGEVVSEQLLKTNAFGSVAGEFIIPNNGLNGSYSIEMFCGEYAYNYVSVEEYKRPKFEAEFKPITETYKVNDSVTVNGTALAYSGSTISDAKVVYRVHRKVQYPRWCYWRLPQVFSEAQEITFGETTTNNKGEFHIKFPALPDPSVDKAYQPIFNYEITADVTDINGETRTATTVVNVGYHALTATVNIDQKLNKKQKDYTLSIDTKNLNGEFVGAKGIVSIYKLVAPKYPLRARPWAAPDYQDISQSEFTKHFPFEAYANEHDKNTWALGERVFKTSFNTENDKNIALGNIKSWHSGAYKVIVNTTDKFKQEVKDEALFTVYSNKDKQVYDQSLFEITTDKSQYKTGDKVTISLGSAAQITVFVNIEKQGQLITQKRIDLNNNKQSFTIPVNAQDIGGFAVNYSFAYRNSFVSSALNINVPYPKTDLEIITKTFRDKLQPGQDETWSFTIKGPKGDKVSAEILASMYDSSLDQFKAHNWSFNPINRPNYYNYSRPNARQSFTTRSFRTYENYKLKHYNKINYNNLNWFGFNIYSKSVNQNYLNLLRIKHSNHYNSNLESGTVIGTIYDETGLPLPGVNVTINNTEISTLTDFDGNFRIKANKGDVLSLTFVGYLKHELKIDKNNSFSIIMKLDESLDEVVVTAMAIKRERKMTKNNYKSQIPTSALRNYDELDAQESRDFGDGNYEGIVGWSKHPSDKDEITTPEKQNDFSGIKIRKNLQETAFFYPQLQTDSKGNISFNFTAPEALTRWKLQLLAYTKTLEHAVTSLEAVTQKELMVTPNAPRFLRHGDTIVVSTKISNLSNNNLKGQAILELTDAITGKPITESLMAEAVAEPAEVLEVTQNFTVDANSNTQVSWTLNIPNNVDAIQYKVIAKAGNFSDGEQNVLPVLSNRMLVTETLPMWVKSDESRTFSLDKLANLEASRTSASKTLKHHKLTLEITSNPAWYAVQALPYLMEYPYDCNEQTFSRYYANALATHIANSNPRIQEVFNQWSSSDALLSNLEKNQDLKSILIQETPWLRNAQSETEQKKRIALLFNLNTMNNELQSALRKLKNNQSNSGAWPWFKGGRDNRYITQHIATGFGHLKKLFVIPTERGTRDEESKMLKKAIKYLDAEFIKEYNDLKTYNDNIDLSKDHLSTMQLHYLYMRSFFKDVKKSKELEAITQYYVSQIKTYWLSRPLYAKGLMALIMHRHGESATASKILKSLKENSITSDELGMYWKANKASWHWYQAPIETQALMIEAFSEIDSDLRQNDNIVDNLKIWLLKNKQVNQWETTKATTEAVYALLLQGSDWLSASTEAVNVSIANKPLVAETLTAVKVEAGTGYYKTSWNADNITPEHANVTLSKQGEGIAWGALYWQYFEDLDKITSSKTPLQLNKQLFIKTNTKTGEQISKITDSTKLEVGDLVRVRIELRTDRDMEFIHMKDMRASGLEPINVLSQYKWQDGLGYYESTKDASTNFFFDYLPKGVYVFEYDLRVNNAGDMSNGITTIQSMYAPEFSSHSEGVRISVKK